MKQFVLVFLFLSFALSLFAQEATEEKTKGIHEIGVNATYFVKQFLNFGESNFSISPYVLSYKYIKDRKALRLGMGLTLAERNEEDIDGSTSDRKTISFSTDYRIGYEYRIPIKTKFLCFTGFDVVGSVRKNKVEVVSPLGGSLSANSVIDFGVGPIFGFEYFMNDRLSLSTTSGFFFRHGITRNETKVGGDFPFQEKSVSTSNTLRYQIPTSLFFNVKF